MPDLHRDTLPLKQSHACETKNVLLDTKRTRQPAQFITNVLCTCHHSSGVGLTSVVYLASMYQKQWIMQMLTEVQNVSPRNHTSQYNRYTIDIQVLPHQSGPDYMERVSPVERAETQPSVQYNMRRASPARLQS